MPTRDLHHNITTVLLFPPLAAQTNSDTARVSAIIDTRGYESCEMVLIHGTNTDANATFAVLVEDGDDSGLSDNAAVADSDLLGTEAAAGFTAAGSDNSTTRIGYRGPKRYVRVTVTPSGNDAGNWFMAGCAILGHPDQLPTV